MSSAWEELGESPSTALYLREAGMHHPSPAQTACLPQMPSRDMAVQAPTGSGKTLAYLLPMMRVLEARPPSPSPFPCINALILLPTRELAMQVYSVLQPLAAMRGMHPLLMIGGQQSKSMEEERAEILSRMGHTRGLVVVGTPGRVQAAMYSKPAVFLTKQLEVLVLDEADRLLEMGFMAQLNQILEKLPKQRRTGCFSATQTQEVKQLIRAGLRDPVIVNVKVLVQSNSQSGPGDLESVQKTVMGGKGKATVGQSSNENMTEVSDQAIPATLRNYFTICEAKEKLNHLVHFLRSHPEEKMIVYFLTCAQVNFFWKVVRNILKQSSHPAPIFSLHGKVPSKQRATMLKNFSTAHNAVLLTTDVASRGLDIPDVQWIVQFDPPQDPKAFVHRIGRTARMGKEGNALVYLLPSEDVYIEFMRLRRVPMEKIVVSEQVEDVVPTAKQMILKERELVDKGQLAFVSFVRAYKKHQCSFIFQFKKLDLADIAESFALLRLPKMPEISDACKAKFNSLETTKIDRIKYSDKEREKRRIVKLREMEERSRQLEELKPKLKAVKVIKKNEAWSKKKARKAVSKGVPVVKSIEPILQKGTAEVDIDDLDDFENDWKAIVGERRLKKKLKKRKISRAEFREEMKQYKIDDNDVDMSEASK